MFYNIKYFIFISLCYKTNIHFLFEKHIFIIKGIYGKNKDIHLYT